MARSPTSVRSLCQFDEESSELTAPAAIGHDLRMALGTSLRNLVRSRVVAQLEAAAARSSTHMQYYVTQISALFMFTQKSAENLISQFFQLSEFFWGVYGHNSELSS